MTVRLVVHPLDPQRRLVAQAVAVLGDDGLIVYPTDSCYALGCRIGAREPMERIARLRQTDRHHNFTLVCRDLAEIATYARVSDRDYRLLRAHTPGPYTFILPATQEVPRRLRNPRRRTIGIRVPDHPVPRAILAALGEPIMSSTLQLPGDPTPLADPDEIEERLAGRVDVIMDSGNCGIEPTSVIDMTGDAPVVLRAGRGDVSRFS